ncbi:NACHT domain-containing protein [Streptomyces sp. NPDC005492]|uniref:NACHT domain-containing protein n=1 Tax=Streptomyces sp. NPDC005492 TaxID=3156883 RepID=UPI00339EF94E
MTGLGGRRHRRNWQLIGFLCVLAIVVSTVYAVLQIIHGGLQSTDIAGLLGFPLGVVGLVTAVVALRKPIEGNDAERAGGWAATLAHQVEKGESDVWQQLLGDDFWRINLAYVLNTAAVRPAAAPDEGRLTTDGASPATLPDIVTYFRSTRPHRLVITGAAGAGKTVLALELMLALIESRKKDDPVPVRVPLARWDTERQSLADVLQERLTETYDWPADMAASLVSHNLVLPVLDGLDEMDPSEPHGAPDPAAPRATAVVRALNSYRQGRSAGPLILTCRTSHYDALAPQTPVLDAARVAVVPVGTADAKEYLIGRALDVDRWTPLTNHLADHPSGPVAAVLSTPWKLCLTATAYQDNGDPAELLNLPDPDALDRHLLARFIPAATRIAPNPRGYTPQNVHRWLHHLTIHLDPVGALRTTDSPGVDATDLVLHELWPLAGRTRVIKTDALLTTLTLLTPLALIWWVPSSYRGWAGGLIALLAAVSGVVSALGTGSPNRLKNPFRSSQGRSVLARGFVSGSVCAFLYALMREAHQAGPTRGVIDGVAFGLAVWLASAFSNELAGEPGKSLRVRAIVRSDALYGLAFGSALGLAVALPVALMGVPGSLAVGFVAGLQIGLSAGLTAGVTLGQMFGPSFIPTGELMWCARASRRYVAFLICSRGRLPFRLCRFLEWAVEAGLLRYSGTAYQYRHRELQHWLRQHPNPAPLP